MHAGQIGHSKTTFVLNWAVNAASTGVNAIYASFESPAETVQKTIDRIRGVRDVEELPHLVVINPSARASRMRDFVVGAERPIDLLIVDSAHMVTPECDEPRGTAGQRLVEVYRDAKRLALGAHGGRPIGVVMVQQVGSGWVSRNGDSAHGDFDDAVLESVDVVTISRNRGASYGGYADVEVRMLKNRQGPLAEPFLVTHDCSTRWMFEAVPPGEEEIEAILKEV
jgi:hypothetical protein